jgi:lipopolysaccharide exporter
VDANFITSVTNVTAIGWTFNGFAALFPPEVLHLMFGAQWDMSAPLVPLFCLAGAFSALVNLVPTVVVAAGHARLTAAAELVIQPVRAVALTLLVYFSRDMFLFALASLIVAIVTVPYFYVFKQRRLPTDFRSLIRNLAKSFLLNSHLCKKLIAHFPKPMPGRWNYGTV